MKITISVEDVEGAATDSAEATLRRSDYPTAELFTAAVIAEMNSLIGAVEDGLRPHRPES